MSGDRLAAGCVVCGAQFVHCVEHLVVVDEGANHDKRAQYCPQPIGGGGDGGRHAAAALLIADARTEIVMPDQPANAQCKPADEEEHETVIHRLFAVVAAGDDVEILGRGGHDDYRVDAERNDAQQNELGQ